MTTTTTTITTFSFTKSLALPYVHAVIIPLIVFGIYSNPLLAGLYLTIPGIVYSTLKKDKFYDFIIPALIIVIIFVAGWADYAPLS